MAQHGEAFGRGRGDGRAVADAQPRVGRQRTARVLHVAQVLRIDHEVVGVLAPIEQHVDKLAEFRRRGVEVARGAQVDLRVRHRRPGAIAIALRQQCLVGARQVKAAGRHADRREGALGDELFVRPAGDLLDQVAGDAVAGVGVRHARSGPPADIARVRVAAQHVEQRQIRWIEPVVDLVEVHVVEAGGVLQQVNDPHRMAGLPRVVERHLRGNLSQWRIEVEVAVLRKLDKRHRNEGLAD